METKKDHIHMSMKIDKLETHDRLLHFTNQSFDITECCQDIINKRPFGDHPFYIFAHARTDDDGFTQRLLWQPRLTKPKAQTNSMLFKAYPGTDIVKVIWMIPKRELWSQFEEGKVTANETVVDSIREFQFNREEMERKEDDDLSDADINAIYEHLSIAAKTRGTIYQKI